MNRGAQHAFATSNELYPLFLGGLGAGKTYAGARKLVTAHCQYRGVDSMVIEPTFRLISDVAIPAIEGALRECGIPFRTRTANDGYATEVPSLGSRIMYFSGMKPERITGFEVGRTWIDEPARIPWHDSITRNVWHNAVQRTRKLAHYTGRWKICLTGTHEGPTWVYDMWEGAARKEGYAIYRGSTYENPHRRNYADAMVDELGEEMARQYVYGEMVDGIGSVLSWPMIEEMQDCDAQSEWKYRKCDGPLYAGIDIGRKKSLTVMWIMEKLGGVFWTRGVCVLKDCPLLQQVDWISGIIRSASFAKVAIDATYNPQTAEMLVDRFGKIVLPVTMTASNKIEMVDLLRSHVKTLKIPVDSDISMDLTSVKRVVSDGGTVKYEAPMSVHGHGDRFWSLALALFGCNSGDRLLTPNSISVPSSGIRAVSSDDRVWSGYRDSRY